jgi:hypothetical protein
VLEHKGDRYPEDSVMALCMSCLSVFCVPGLRYSLGYDWDSVLPGAAAVLASLNLQPVALTAKSYVEGFILATWQVKTTSA